MSGSTSRLPRPPRGNHKQRVDVTCSTPLSTPAEEATHADRPQETKTGTLTALEGLFVDGYSPRGPCVIAPTDYSQLRGISTLPREAGAAPGGGGDGAAAVSSALALLAVAVFSAVF